MSQMRVQAQLFLAPPPARTVDLVCLGKDLINQAQQVEQSMLAPVTLLGGLPVQGNRDAPRPGRPPPGRARCMTSRQGRISSGLATSVRRDDERRLSRAVQ
jgi:hypothetical protein